MSDPQVVMGIALFLGCFIFVLRRMTDRLGPSTHLRPLEWSHVVLAFALILVLTPLADALPAKVWGTSWVSAVGTYYVFAISGAHALGLAAMARQHVSHRWAVRVVSPLAAAGLFTFAWSQIGDADFLNPWSGLLGFLGVLLASYLDWASQPECLPGTPVRGDR